MVKLIVIGGLAIDCVSRIRNSKDACTQVLDYSENIGGMAYNTAVAASQLGINTTLVSAVGFDMPKLKPRNNLQLDLHYTKGKTPRSFLFFDDNSERIYFYRGVYHKIDLKRAAVSIKKADWVHFAGIVPCFIDLVNTAKENCKIISVNPGYDLSHYDPKERLVQTLINKSDYLILNSREADYLDFDPHVMKDKKNIIITSGNRGSTIHSRMGIFKIPTYVVNVRSPFGAGDVYTATLIAALINDKDLVEAAKFASAAGSFAVEEETTTPKLSWSAIRDRAKKLKILK